MDSETIIQNNNNELRSNPVINIKGINSLDARNSSSDTDSSNYDVIPDSGELTEFLFSEVQHYTGLGSFYDGKKSDRYLYVAAGIEGLIILDVIDPTNIIQIGQVKDNNDARSIVVEGDFAYLLNYLGRFDIIDISDPTSPTIRQSSELVGDMCSDFVIRDEIAYIAAGTGQFCILNVSDSYAPKLLRRVEWWAQGVDLYGDIAYVASGGNGMLIVNISDPGDPFIMNQYTRYDISDVKVVGERAYLASERDGIHIVDLSTPKTPKYIGGLSLNAYVDTVEVIGNFAFIGTQNNKVFVINFSDPQNPQQVVEKTLNMISRIHISDYRFIYAFTENEGLYLYDVGDDTDGDLIPDAIELHLGTDIDKVDTDSDEWSDYDEIIHGSDPLNPDDTPETVHDDDKTANPFKDLTTPGYSTAILVSLILVTFVVVIKQTKKRI